MENKMMAETIRELMTAYNDNRQKWIASKGTEEGFDEWFTGQVIK